MIQEICPNGVEYRKLDEVTFKITDGMHNLPKGIVPIGEYPIISAQNIKDGRIDISVFLKLTVDFLVIWHIIIYDSARHAS